MTTTSSEYRPDFSTLPDLVLFKIFEFLKGPRELVHYDVFHCKCRSDPKYDYSRDYFLVNGQYGSILDARMVCKKFHSLAWDRRLLTELRIHPQISMRDLIRVIQERPLIEELIINFSRCCFPFQYEKELALKTTLEEKGSAQKRNTSWEDHPDEVCQLFKTLRKLKTLKLKGVSYNTCLNHVLFEAFESSKDTLTTLHLEEIEISKNFNFETIRNFAKVKVLKVNDLDEEKWKLALEMLTSLEELILDQDDEFEWSIPEEKFENLLKKKSLKISYCDIDDGTLSFF